MKFNHFGNIEQSVRKSRAEYATLPHSTNLFLANIKYLLIFLGNFSAVFHKEIVLYKVLFFCV